MTLDITHRYRWMYMEKTLKKKIAVEKELLKKTPSVKFLARFDEAQYNALQAEARRSGLSMNTMIKVACQDMLDSLSKKKVG